MAASGWFWQVGWLPRKRVNQVPVDVEGGLGGVVVGRQPELAEEPEKQAERASRSVWWM